MKVILAAAVMLASAVDASSMVAPGLINIGNVDWHEIVHRVNSDPKSTWKVGVETL